MVAARQALADRVAVLFGTALAPALRFLARHRQALPRFQAFADRAGFQLRSDHYYEPTYAEAHLPGDTAGERSLPGIDLDEAGQLTLLERFTYADELQALPQDKPAPAWPRLMLRAMPSKGSR